MNTTFCLSHPLPEEHLAARRHRPDSTGTYAAWNLHPFPAACLDKLRELKTRVREHLDTEYGDSVHAGLISQAVHEADSLAATTPYPVLFLPTLAEEKVRSAAAWQHRQEAIRRQTLAMVA